MDTISAAGMRNPLASPWACSLLFHSPPYETIRSRLISEGARSLLQKHLPAEKFFAVFDHEALERHHLR